MVGGLTEGKLILRAEYPNAPRTSIMVLAISSHSLFVSISRPLSASGSSDCIGEAKQLSYGVITYVNSHCPE